jgi:hypothetical protein
MDFWGLIMFHIPDVEIYIDHLLMLLFTFIYKTTYFKFYVHYFKKIRREKYHLKHVMSINIKWVW